MNIGSTPQPLKLIQKPISQGRMSVLFKNVSMNENDGQHHKSTGMNVDLSPIQSTAREEIQLNMGGNKPGKVTSSGVHQSIESIKIQSYRDYAGSRQGSVESQTSSKGMNNLTLVDKNIISQAMKSSADKQHVNLFEQCIAENIYEDESQKDVIYQTKEHRKEAIKDDGRTNNFDKRKSSSLFDTPITDRNEQGGQVGSTQIFNIDTNNGKTRGANANYGADAVANAADDKEKYAELDIAGDNDIGEQETSRFLQKTNE